MNLRDELQDKEFRDAFVVENIRTAIAHQIRINREKRKWSQSDLAKRTSKTQSVISRLEDPDYGKLSLQTLFDLAKSFDIALDVRFVSFRHLIERVSNTTADTLFVPSFDNEPVKESAPATDNRRSNPAGTIFALAEAFSGLGAVGQRRQSLVATQYHPSRRTELTSIQEDRQSARAAAFR